MTLDEIWASLEEGVTAGPAGQALARRIHPDSPRDIRLAVDALTHARMLLVRVSSAALDSGLEFPSASGFELRHVPLPGDGNRKITLGVILTRPDQADVFTSLVDDIARRVAAAESDSTAVLELIARLRRWQGFLQRHEPEGLGPHERRGLYGELWFLRQHLMAVLPPREAVVAWSGPRAANHDFHLPACAVEVKTSTGKQHQLLHIASERQLDDTGAGTLVLFHLSLDERTAQGETLVGIVEDVRSRMASDPVAAEELDTRLIDAGYLDSQAYRYSSEGYALRDSGFFHVEEQFPRITEGYLRPGVGDVRYTIALTACQPFSMTEHDARALMTHHHEKN
jgi:Putative  PD-(D/E)XK family member, (DUF4420)